MKANDATPNTGQTGQKGPAGKPYFELAKDAEGNWHWLLWSSNGRQTATNPVAYARRSDCIQAVRLFKETIAAAKIVVISHM